MKKSIYLLLLFVVVSMFSARADEPLRVLAIGNSFSVDALEQEMHNVAASAGCDIIIGNLYIPGCSVDRHYENIVADAPAYSYRKIDLSGRADTIADCALSKALADEPWDVITFQQASHFSGIDSTYVNLPRLIAKVREQAGPHPKFLWHMTWAYSPDSDHSGFKSYGNDQMTMYRAIVASMRKALADNPELAGVIPVGTAIQNARATELGPDLTRDGYHLSLDAGRFIASCTWFGVLFDKPVSGINYRPGHLTPMQCEAIRRAVQDALGNPYDVKK